MKALWDKHWPLLLTAVIIAACWGLSTVARAGDSSAQLSWQPPTTYDDNVTPLAASSIQEYLIEWRRPGVVTVVGSTRVTAPALSTVVNNLTCGDFEFQLYTVLKTSDVSGPSAPAPYTVSCKPNPPKAVTAQ